MKLPRMPDGKELLAYDIEIFRNYSLVVLTDGEKFKHYERMDFARLAHGVNDANLVLGGFNNFKYDDVILRSIIENPDITSEELFAMSQKLIEAKTKEAEEWVFQKTYMERPPWAYSLDIFQCLNAKGSLKEWSCRENSPEIEETPHDFEKPLPEDLILDVRKYCQIDCANTVMLITKHWEKVILRHKLNEQFPIGPKIYRLPEQGIAQATFLALHKQATGEYRNEVEAKCKKNPDNKVDEWPMQSIVNPKVNFTTTPFQDVFEALMVNSAKAADDRRTEWALTGNGANEDWIVDLAGKQFAIGVGGLHSVDGPGRFDSSESEMIVDLDVTSYYPSIIIEDELFPKHMGPTFYQHMRQIRDLRVKAKKAGDAVTSDALKIVVNSTFGKLNDFYSPLRSIPDALRVTVNGQLYLLMLVEALYQNGFEILSGNTDGVTIRMPRTEMAEGVLRMTIDQWQEATGFQLERANYVRYARQHVNSYIAVTDKGKVKCKGLFAEDTAKADGRVIKRAAVQWLTKRIPIERTLADAATTDFIFYNRCKSGGTLYYGDEHVGRLARWVASTEGASVERTQKNKKTGDVSRVYVGPSAHRCMLVRDIAKIDRSKIDMAFYRQRADDLVCETMANPPKLEMLAQRRLM